MMDIFSKALYDISVEITAGLILFAMPVVIKKIRRRKQKKSWCHTYNTLSTGNVYNLSAYNFGYGLFYTKNNTKRSEPDG